MNYIKFDRVLIGLREGKKYRRYTGWAFYDYEFDDGEFRRDGARISSFSDKEISSERWIELSN